MKWWWITATVALLLLAGSCRAEGETEDSSDAAAQAIPTAEDDLGKSKEGSRTDDEVIEREEEAIKIDGLNAAQVKELREQAEKHQFEAEVNRMMKLIINSLYRNKEIFLRELISNASDALDKIRFLSLTDASVLGNTEELTIKIKADKENHVIHVTDTGIGMTKEDLVKNLGTIAKSGTSEFISKMTDAQTDSTLQGDLIGQFGVGFYSSFLVADTVVVTSKHNDDEQYIWESSAGEFSVSKDPRGNTLGRGTQVSLYLKEEAYDFAEPDTLKNLIKKYSQFINFNIYLWTSKTEEVEEPIEDDEEEAEDKKDEEKKDDDDASVEEEKPEKPKTKKVEKTTWDWELMNSDKPIWTRKPKEVEDKEYDEFYKSFTKESDAPLAKIHFVAEGEVTFRSILFVPKTAPMGYYQDATKRIPSVKLYVRRVFITDEFEDLIPRYLSFIKGLVDSDDLPLNVSRETLQQHKLLKVIRKKLVRKALDMIKKIDPEQYKEFWKEFGTSIKMGIIEDHSNRTRLAKLLRFLSSNHKEDMTTLLEYVERMKDKQEHIYYIAGVNREELETSPFVERLLKKGYEVLYLIDTVDEYAVQSLPEFEGKKFQNVAKDGLTIGDETEKSKKTQQALETKFKPLTDWLQEKPLKDKIEKAVISKRLADSPCALVASQFGWSGNMERIMAAQAHGGQRDTFYFNQKKILEINPRHPLIKKLLSSVEENADDTKSKDLAEVLYETAVLRSGYALKDTSGFAGRVERMLRLSLNVDLDEQVEEEAEEAEEEEEEVSGDDSDGAAESDDSADDTVKADEDAVEPAPTSEDADAAPDVAADATAEDTGDSSKDEL